MMRQLAIIRTHRWGEEEERALAALRPAFGEDVVVAYHNRKRGQKLPIPVVDVTAAWVVTSGLRAVPDYGWRCGDYFYHATRQARPDYDYYWMMEPDVGFTGDSAAFFARFDDASEDVLGRGLKPYEEDIPFIRGMPGVPHWKAIFPFTRFSGRALDHLRPLRCAYGQGTVGNRFFTNDEIFCFTTIMNSPGFTGAPLEKYAADWLEDSSFDTNPTIMLEAVLADPPVNKVMHPVRSRYEFKRAIAARLASNTGFLRRMRYSLTHLSDEDFNEILADAMVELRRSLNEHRDIGAQAIQRRQDWTGLVNQVPVNQEPMNQEPMNQEPVNQVPVQADLRTGGPREHAANQ